jgi:hypothetical protein
MSTEKEKLYARTESAKSVWRARNWLRDTQVYTGPMPKPLVDAIERELAHLGQLYARIKAWPVTQTERDRARMKKLADRAARQ